MNYSDVLAVEVVLASAVGTVLLIVLSYLVNSRRRPKTLPSQPVETERIIPTPPAILQSMPLPRLEPLAFGEILRKSVAEYRANLILLVPVIVMFIQTEVTGAVSSSYLTPKFLSSIRATPFSATSLHFLLFELFVVYSSLIVSFLVLLGQVSMTAKVVTDRECRLGDWLVGVRKYFLTVFAISLIFSIMFAAGEFLSGQLYSDLKPLGPMVASIVYYLLSVPLSILTQSVFYVCLAGVPLDRNRFRAAFRMGVRAISSRRSAFAWFLILSVAVLLGLQALGYAIVSILSTAPSPLRWIAVAYAFVEVLPSPLWFLIAFRIYGGFNAPTGPLASIQSEQGKDGFVKASSGEQCCIACGGHIPLDAKFCTECGSKQE